MENIKEEKKECRHYFETGWVADLIVFCVKCNQEVDDIYGKDIYKEIEYKTENGNLINRTK
jgi:hypothetical protein